MYEDFTENEETITNCKNQIQITNKTGTYIVSIEDFASKFHSYILREKTEGPLQAAHTRGGLIDFIENYEAGTY